LLEDQQLQADLGLQVQEGQLVARGADCKKAFLALAGALARAHGTNETEAQQVESKQASKEEEKIFILVDGLDEAWCVLCFTSFAFPGMV